MFSYLSPMLKIGSARRDFDKRHRVDSNKIGCKPHLIEPFQDTESPSITFGVAGLRKQILTINVVTDTQRDQINFTVPRGFEVEGDCLAAAMACLCGTTYDRISFQFAVSDEAQSLIAEGCAAEVVAQGHCEPRQPGKGNCLAFSGGMDSLASKYIAPDRNYHLMGTDFGGWFEREYSFLLRYREITSVCSTDFRRKKYSQNTWQFMVAPMLLVANHFDWGSMALGTTLESSPYTLFELGSGVRRLPFYEAAGMPECTLLNGASEFLGSRIVFENEPRIVNRSLKSLAAKGSEKSFRKALALELVKALLEDKSTAQFDIKPPSRKVELGKAVFVDFAFLLFLKFCDRAWLSKVVDIPDTLAERVQAIKCEWLLKYHPIGLENVAGQAKRDLQAGLVHNGIEVFSDDDLANYREFISVVKQVSGFERV